MHTLAARASSRTDSQGGAVARPRCVIERAQTDRKRTKERKRRRTIFSPACRSAPVVELFFPPEDLFFSDHGSQQVEVEEEGEEEAPWSVTPGDYWTPYCSNTRTSLAFRSAGDLEVFCFVFWFSGVRGSREHVERTSQSPAEGSLAAVSVAR